MTTYQKYRSLMNALSYSFQGVDLSHVSATKIWSMAKGERVFGLKQFARFFIALDASKLQLPENNGFLATFMENYRKDHYDLFNTVVNGLSNKPTVTNLFDVKRRVAFHPILAAKITITVYRKLLKENISLVDKLRWAAEYMYLVNNIKELDKIDFSKVKKYLCMCHVLSLENLLTQYLKTKGIVTYSLQEGIYFIFKKNIVLGSIAYELFVTDHLLCWGQYTKDEYKKYGIDPSKITVSGYPKCKVLAPLKNNNVYKTCLVMLAGPIIGNANTNLLMMLESLKDEFDITLKSHPANYLSMEKYAQEHNFSIIDKTQTVGECLESGRYDFCIAVNTTAYYESWMVGVPCVRYYDERFDNFYGFDDFFSDEEQFKTMINGYRICPKNENEIKEMLKYAIGFGLDNYDKVINGNLL